MNQLNDYKIIYLLHSLPIILAFVIPGLLPQVILQNIAYHFLISLFIFVWLLDSFRNLGPNDKASLTPAQIINFEAQSKTKKVLLIFFVVFAISDLSRLDLPLVMQSSLIAPLIIYILAFVTAKILYFLEMKYIPLNTMIIDTPLVSETESKKNAVISKVFERILKISVAIALVILASYLVIYYQII